MNRATPQMRDFAQRLMAAEADAGKAPEAKLPPASHVFEQLRPRLATLIGTGGFRTLLSRALALASAEVPWLRAVKVNAEGVLAGWEDVPAHVDKAKILEGVVVLLAQLLGLLVAFIGLDLTSRLVGGTGPHLSRAATDSVKGAKNEKTN